MDGRQDEETAPDPRTALGNAYVRGRTIPSGKVDYRAVLRTGYKPQSAFESLRETARLKGSMLFLVVLYVVTTSVLIAVSTRSLSAHDAWRSTFQLVRSMATFILSAVLSVVLVRSKSPVPERLAPTITLLGYATLWPGLASMFLAAAFSGAHESGAIAALSLMSFLVVLPWSIWIDGHAVATANDVPSRDGIVAVLIATVIISLVLTFTPLWWMNSLRL
jgi:hypothetical protein